jgi:hypothetical protein
VSKTAIDWSQLDSEPELSFVWPVLLSAHCTGSEPGPAQFHVLYASFGMAGYGAQVLYVPILNWNWGDDLIITELQNGLTSY